MGLTSEDNAGTVWRELFTLPAPHWPGPPGQIVPRLPCGQPGHQLGADGGLEGEAGHGAGVEGDEVGREKLRPAGSQEVNEDNLLLTEDDQGVRLGVGLYHNEVNDLGTELERGVLLP